MTERRPHDSEIDKLVSADGQTVFSIRRRGDGHYEVYIERLCFDDEENKEYWMQHSSPEHHIFGSIPEARNEILARFGDQIDTT